MMFKKKIITGCDDRGDGNEPYLTRYFLMDNKYFQLCIHVFHRSDFEDLHDHPWHFASLVLWRGYYEETEVHGERNWIRKRPGMLLIRKAEHRHRVVLDNGKKAVTLVWMGRKFRTWGFFTKAGFVKWTKYFIDNKC